MAKKKFQPTPPHRGRRHGQRDQRNGAGISTHAPAQGATIQPKGGHPAQDISTHAPAQGATAFF